jgi:hypothetical protein
MAARYLPNLFFAHPRRKFITLLIVPRYSRDFSDAPQVDYPEYVAGDGYTTLRRNPYSLSPLVYGLLVALITLVVVGAALGGGLGASLASAQSRKYVTAWQMLLMAR